MFYRSGWLRCVIMNRWESCLMFWAFELVLMLTWGGIYYIIYYTIIILLYIYYYIILYILYLILYSSLPLQSFSSQSISFLFPLPKLILFFPPHLISSPFTILSFKVYVSAFGYPYLCSISIGLCFEFWFRCYVLWVLVFCWYSCVLVFWSYLKAIVWCVYRKSGLLKKSKVFICISGIPVL